MMCPGKMNNRKAFIDMGILRRDYFMKWSDLFDNGYFHYR